MNRSAQISAFIEGLVSLDSAILDGAFHFIAPAITINYVTININDVINILMTLCHGQ